MKIYAIMVKQENKPSLRFMTGTTNGHIPGITCSFNDAITFVEKKDALNYIERIKKYKDDLEFAGIAVNKGCFLVSLDLEVNECISLR